MGRLTPPPPFPTQAASALASLPAVVWVSANKDLWAVPDSEFIAHESVPVYKSAWKTYSRSAGIKWGPRVCVCHVADDTGRMNWRGTNHSPGESAAKAEFDSIQRS